MLKSIKKKSRKKLKEFWKRPQKTYTLLIITVFQQFDEFSTKILNIYIYTNSHIIFENLVNHEKQITKYNLTIK